MQRNLRRRRITIRQTDNGEGVDKREGIDRAEILIER